MAKPPDHEYQYSTLGPGCHVCGMLRSLHGAPIDHEPELEPSAPGKPLHDAKRDPSAVVRLGEPGLALVQAISELDLLARRVLELGTGRAFDALDECREANRPALEAAVALAAFAPELVALCARSLELIDLLEATRESLRHVERARPGVREALVELDEQIAREVPAAIADIDAALLSPLEVKS